MNRIILIGNGFDLAHGLKSSYNDFLINLWSQILKEITFKPNTSHHIGSHSMVNVSIANENFYKFNTVKNYQGFKSVFCVNETNWSSKFRNKFLYAITEENLKTWYDVEEIYYELLCNCSKLTSRKLKSEIKKINITINKLNDDFKDIQNRLELYLNDIQKEYEENEDIIKRQDEIYEHIYSQFNKNDFTTEGYELISNDEYSQFQTYLKYGYHNPSNPFDEETKMKYKELQFYGNYENREYFQRQLNLHPYNFDLLPDNIMFLNFNYTLTDKYYDNPIHATTKNIKTTKVHIHGELNNQKNPIIFGYGDELCDRYNELEKLKDNHYLENIKSIKYLNTDNYKKVLSFIDSEPYQIFIFGHSCGNSDRTLLNTLFEHENCYSIKPFYYKWDETDENGKTESNDNYSDMVRNISRCFDKKSMMRKKVVDKTHCQPLRSI